MRMTCSMLFAQRSRGEALEPAAGQARLPMKQLHRTFPCAVLAIAVHAGIATAQSGGLASVHVRLVDANDAPIAAADLRLYRASDRTIVGRTDRNGSAVLQASADTLPFELEVRRVGFISTRRLVRVDGSGARPIQIRLARLELRLDTVRTVERELPRNYRPVVDSTEIAASKRAIIDLLDVVHKLRPGMLFPNQRCRGSSANPSLRIYVDDRYVPPLDFVEVRRNIYADHIAEVRYVACFDRALKKDDHPQAGHLFVTLKPGYAFHMRRGSYAVGAEAAPRVAEPRYPGFRGRFVGVFDEVSGQALEGVAATDILTRQTLSTSRTGDLHLFFVDTTGGMIRFEKLGYLPLVMWVDNSPGAPDLTLTLQPRSEKVVNAKAARSAADTSAKLEAVGFYSRRDDWAAGNSLFFSADEIQNAGTVSRFLALTRRPSCVAEIRIDGTQVAPDTTGTFTWIDLLLTTGMVAAAEVHAGDLPADIAKPVATDRQCLTLIWTR